MKKTIALVAHDNEKKKLIQWVLHNQEKLRPHVLVCTGTTGKLVQEALQKSPGKDPELIRLKSGPLGGDQQMGAMIAEGKVGIFIFFWDPMTAQPHDVDVKALLRISTLYNIPTATNQATADFLISSPFFEAAYKSGSENFQAYLERKLEV